MVMQNLNLQIRHCTQRGITDDKNIEIYNIHVGEGDVVLEVTGEVSLDESLCLCKCLVSTTAEEGNAREAQ